jgi:hypothetical protein
MISDFETDAAFFQDEPVSLSLSGLLRSLGSVQRYDAKEVCALILRSSRSRKCPSTKYSFVAHAALPGVIARAMCSGLWYLAT